VIGRLGNLSVSFDTFAHAGRTQNIKHAWGAVQICSLVFLISFGHVGRYAAS
jgi:hypothetical protein